ncbi:MAG: translocation/assembly module TamB domain-containing protein [Campylobacterota bacterium]|nr:translocation/assembly module TamB domain-containing protein [Campylobacterota bacterium]
MMKSLYLILHYLVFLALILFFVLIFLLSHPRVLELISYELSQNDKVEFSHIEGTLSEKIILHNINYKNSLFIEKLTIEYNLLSIIFGNRKIDKMEIIRPRILSKLYKNRAQSSEQSYFKIPNFTIGSIAIVDALVEETSSYGFSFNLSNLSYQDKKVDVEEIKAKVEGEKNHLSLDGRIRNTVFEGQAIVTYDSNLTQSIEGIFKEIPKTLHLDIKHADINRIRFSTQIETLALQEQNISLNTIAIESNFEYKQDFISLHVRHDINETRSAAHIEHNITIGFDATLQDSLHVSIKQTPFLLPFEDVYGSLDINNSALSFIAATSCSETILKSSDFDTYTLESHLDALDLNFLPDLPPSLREHSLSTDLNMSYIQSAQTLQGYIDARTSHTSYRGDISFDTKHLSSDGIISTDGNTDFWKSLPVKNLDDIHLITDFSLENSMLYATSEELHVTLFDNNKKIKGWGSFATSEFNFRGDYNEERILMNVDSHIPSLYTAIDTVYDLNLSEGMIFDCALDMNATLMIDDTLHVSNRVSLPWYLAMSDKDNIIYGTDANFTLSTKANILSIDSYSFNLFNRDFFASKPSRLHYNDDTIDIETFWINDGIKMSGDYKLNTKTLNLKADAESYHYKGDEGEADIDLHVRISHDDNGSEVEGSIELKNTLITYKPIATGIVQDEDIILIQDIEDPEKSPLALNVQIFSKEPIRYKMEDIDVDFTPDVTLYKESMSEMEILGWLATNSGHVYNSGSAYDIKKSEVYFAGGAINPYLNLHLYYEIDDKEIDIYVTHTLASPVLLFTSNPPMSQSDIISYLLFGTPANNSFDSDGSSSNGINAANIFLGTGLKQMIGDTTGLRIDTLNLLSKEDGGIGFEVGTRVSRDVRIILKNDDIFSMVLQMSLSKSLRLDVDVQETGQGVNIMYVKDYKDFLSKSLNTD